jgi:molecular chaperone DnaJ
MGAEDLSDIFEEMFGAGRAGGRRSGGSPFDFGGGFGDPRGHASGASGVRAAQKGQDVEHTISITFMTAALGGTEQLRFTGEGNTSTLSVKIPPGIESGGKLRLKGKGQPSPFGGPAGDLILNVEVGQHPYFTRDGLDLFIDVPITISEAVQGTTVSVPLIKPQDGAKSVQIKVPPGVSSGAKLRVRGKGIINTTGKVGDYYAVIQIVAPVYSSLSQAAQKAIHDLAAELKNPRDRAPYAEISDDQ